MFNGLIKVRQLLITVKQYPEISCDVKIRDIEVWEDEIVFYQEGDKISIHNFQGDYTCEIFFCIDTPDEQIHKVEQLVKNKLIEYFEQVIAQLTALKFKIAESN
jgi:hypothetical protein